MADLRDIRILRADMQRELARAKQQLTVEAAAAAEKARVAAVQSATTLVAAEGRRIETLVESTAPVTPLGLLPAGGTTGQVPANASNTSYYVAWVDPGSSSGTLSWTDYALHWDTTPTLVSAGVYSYVWLGVTRYRTVPDPYVASDDAFYSDAGLTTLIVARGQ